MTGNSPRGASSCLEFSRGDARKLHIVQADRSLRACRERQPVIMEDNEFGKDQES